MAKNTGKNAAISFDGIIYRCLTQLAISGSVSVATAECSQETGNAATHKAVGAANQTASVTVLTDDDSIALETAFALGASGELIHYPHGTDVGMKSQTWTSAFVSSNNESVAVATQSTMALAFECDGVYTPALVVA